MHKAPAGVDTVLSGQSQPYVQLHQHRAGRVAERGVNLIKSDSGYRVVIWGARTRALGTPDRYVPVRRLLIALKTSLDPITRFAVFEGNDEDLRGRPSRRSSVSYLQTQFDLGAFKGETSDEAFYVRLRRHQQPAVRSRTRERSYIEVGVALKSPAEFIVIRLGQQQAGTIRHRQPGRELTMAVSLKPSLSSIATDPFRNFKFRVVIHHPGIRGFATMGFMAVSGLVHHHRGDPVP